ncbi:MAG: ParB/RepB/Spo0J family partition protein [Clostridia bacterium]|nr:ParB/RepB/Spo0J family partition protein [Clostridia bacterium]
MKSSAKNVTLTSVDDLFTTEEEREDKKREKVRNIPLSELHPFRDHPFRVVDDEKMEETVESIREYGVLVPIIARPKEEGGYEIVSGHRRCHASKIAGLETVPTIVRHLDDDEATIIMVDSNLQRESLLPSERAKAYKMKLDAIRRCAGRPKKENCTQIGYNFDAKRSVEIIAQDAGDSKSQVIRFVRLTELIPDLLDMVDEKKLNLNSAVEISYLPHEEQELVHETILSEDHTPSIAQAQEIKRLSQKKQLNEDTILPLFEKKEDVRTHQKTEVQEPPMEQQRGRESSPCRVENTKAGKVITIPVDQFAKYMPNRSEEQITELVLKILDNWFHHMRKTRSDQSR